jgi:hypothetical protein
VLAAEPNLNAEDCRMRPQFMPIGASFCNVNVLYDSRRGGGQRRESTCPRGPRGRRVRVKPKPKPKPEPKPEPKPKPKPKPMPMPDADADAGTVESGVWSGARNLGTVG